MHIVVSRTLELPGKHTIFLLPRLLGTKLEPGRERYATMQGLNRRMSDPPLILPMHLSFLYIVEKNDLKICCHFYSKLSRFVSERRAQNFYKLGIRRFFVVWKCRLTYFGTPELLNVRTGAVDSAA